MPEGHQIVFEQESDESPDTTPGDVIFKLKTLPHKRFSRKGNDLHTSMTITLLEVSQSDFYRLRFRNHFVLIWFLLGSRWFFKENQAFGWT